MSDFKTDGLKPCRCGFKPDHYSVYYGSTPYDVYCPNCKKQLARAKCQVTNSHVNVIDYWNKKIADMTAEEINSEIEEFQKQKDKIERAEGMSAKQYEYYWHKDRGEVLHQKW